MKVGMISAALALAALWASPASAETMDAILANTLTTQGADGAVVRWTFNADGTYRMTLPTGQSYGGAYVADAQHFCITPAGGAQSCVAAAPEGKWIGDTWQALDAAGNRVSVAIVAGR